MRSTLASQLSSDLILEAILSQNIYVNSRFWKCRNNNFNIITIFCDWAYILSGRNPALRQSGLSHCVLLGDQSKTEIIVTD